MQPTELPPNPIHANPVLDSQDLRSRPSTHGTRPSGKRPGTLLVVPWRATGFLATRFPAALCMIAYSASLLLLGRPLRAEANSVNTKPGWSRTVLANKARPRVILANVAHLALDRRGTPHVMFVERVTTPDRHVDMLRYARGLAAGRFRQESVIEQVYARDYLSGIVAWTIALDRYDRPIGYWFLRDYQRYKPKPDLVTGERIVRRIGSTGRWQMDEIRTSVNSLAGGVVGDPHLVADLPGQFHLTAYMHNAFGIIHRVRYRYHQGNAYPIEPLPRPPGKSDSQVSNLILDRRRNLHIVYSATRALHGGHPEPGYPDSAIAYVLRQGDRFDAPQFVARSVGSSPQETDVFVRALGLAVDDRDRLHVIATVAAPYREGSTRVLYFRGGPGAWQKVFDEPIPSQDRSHRSVVFGPSIDRKGTSRFALSDGRSTYLYALTASGLARRDTLAGNCLGYAYASRTGEHLLLEVESADQANGGDANAGGAMRDVRCEYFHRPISSASATAR